MKKLAISMVTAITAMSAMLTSITASAATAIENEDSLQVVTYNYMTKTEQIDTLNRASHMTAMEADLNTENLEDISITEAYNPGLTDARSATSTFSIIGDDDQDEVDPNVFPYSAVLCLRLGQDTNGDGVTDSWGLGTGFLEGYDVMATAGHCFWGGSTNGWVEECRIYTRQDSSTFGTEYYYPLSWTCATEYINNRDWNYDWCAVTLQDNLGSANGWFGKGCSSGSIADTDVTISGYPAETASKIGHQYTHSGTVSSSTEYRANYSIDTEGGNSGSPVYDENGIVWAIHTHGGNSGARITSWLYDILQNKYLEGVEKWG